MLNHIVNEGGVMTAGDRVLATSNRKRVAARILVKNPVDAYIHASAICKLGRLRKRKFTYASAPDDSLA
jgi:hypothetical protein